jgi:hypothetical protein
MPIKGDAGRQYHREYMRRLRDALKGGVKPVQPAAGAAEMDALKAELAAANAEIWTLKTLCWRTHGAGGGRYFSMAEPLAGAYGIHWTALRRPVSRGGSGEKRPLPEGDSYEANFSPWGKNNRRKKTQQLGTFPTLDEAMAACQEHARAHPA